MISQIPLSIWLTIIGLIIALFSTLVKLYAVTRKEPTEIQKAQQNLVMELLGQLHGKIVLLTYEKYQDSSVSRFNVGARSLLNIDQPISRLVVEGLDISNLPIVIPETEKELIELNRFLTNPLLPKEFLEPLNKISTINQSYSSPSNYDEERIILSNYNHVRDNRDILKRPKKSAEVYYCRIGTSYSDFNSGISQLNKVASEWLKKNKLDHLNFFLDKLPE
jgi:archaellum component FlaF (FlaF/FlaG flagellin family)